METIRIAIAEDHTIVRKALVSMLNEDPHMEVVYDATDGEALIDYVDAQKEKPDVCMLDINMPKKDGHETLKYLKAKYPDMRFLILTQHEHELVIIRMLRAGANAYVLKDSEPDELKRAIRTIMKQPYFQSRLISGHLHAMVQGKKDHEHPELTDTEMEFLRHCCSELGYKEIAALMNISERKIDYFRDSLFAKLHTQSRTGLALYALRLGLVKLDG
jgi:DNA-binding NarL/FixJ family response regulator